MECIIIYAWQANAAECPWANNSWYTVIASVPIGQYVKASAYFKGWMVIMCKCKYVV